MRDNLGNEYELGVTTANWNGNVVQTLTIQPQSGYFTAGQPGNGFSPLTIGTEQFTIDQVNSLQSRVDYLETIIQAQTNLIEGLSDQVNKLLKIKEVSTLKLEKEMR